MEESWIVRCPDCGATKAADHLPGVGESCARCGSTKEPDVLKRPGDVEGICPECLEHGYCNPREPRYCLSCGAEMIPYDQWHAENR